MLIWACDPGTLQSALVVVDVSHVYKQPIVVEACTVLNAALLPRLETAPLGSTLVIEGMESFGMPVGYEVLETCVWIGRFLQCWPNPNAHRLTRRQVKLHLCGSMQANDAHVRTTLLDRFGPGKELAIGTTKRRGPLYGLKGHEFSALAVAMTWIETHATQPVAVAQAVTQA